VELLKEPAEIAIETLPLFANAGKMCLPEDTRQVQAGGDRAPPPDVILSLRRAQFPCLVIFINIGD
jgi:hypothetical protein